MLGELPKLFDRNYAMAYFLPVLLFLAAGFGLVAGVGCIPQLIASRTGDPAAVAAGLAIAAWLGGFLLLALNRTLYQILEGYGRYNPLQLNMRRERGRYQRLHKQLEALYRKQEGAQGMDSRFTAKDRARLRRLQQDEAEQFPHLEDLLLPTALGNTIRAFEVYPGIMYGINTVVGWNRLYSLLPKDYRDLIDTAKAVTDFWLNLQVLSLALVAEWIALALLARDARFPWVPTVAFVITLFAANRTRVAAVEWGDAIKSAFDVFLPDLGAKLRLPQQTDRDTERAHWAKVTQAILFRRPDVLPALAPPTPPTPPLSTPITTSAAPPLAPVVTTDSPSLAALPDATVPSPTEQTLADGVEIMDDTTSAAGSLDRGARWQQLRRMVRGS